MATNDEVVKAAQSVEARTGVPAAVLLAVAEVETNGVAYASFGGRREPLIRFEGHYFDRLLGTDARRHARAAGLADPKAGAVRNPAAQSARWRLLDRAAAIDANAAYASVSWGLGQVMGAHWKSLGFADPRALAVEARRSAEGQFSIVARFLLAEQLDRLLPQGAFAAFARRYNGPGYLKNAYDTKIEAAFAKAGARLGGAVQPLGPGARGARVAELQRALSGRGFALVPDGIFGTRTARAVSAFRLSQGLPAGSFADAEMLGRLSETGRTAGSTVSKGWLRRPVMLSTALPWLTLRPSSPAPTRSSSTSTERSSASPTIPQPSPSRPPPSSG